LNAEKAQAEANAQKQSYRPATLAVDGFSDEDHHILRF